jgi:hypothetical protein
VNEVIVASHQTICQYNVVFAVVLRRCRVSKRFFDANWQSTLPTVIEFGTDLHRLQRRPDAPGLAEAKNALKESRLDYVSG